jgi:hypothetical protein
MTTGVATVGAGMIGVSAARAVAGRRFERELRRAALDERAASPVIPSVDRRAA